MRNCSPHDDGGDDGGGGGDGDGDGDDDDDGDSVGLPVFTCKKQTWKTVSPTQPLFSTSQQC